MEKPKPQDLEEEMEEEQRARRPQSRMALFVDIILGAIGGIIIAFLIWILVGLVGLTEVALPVSLLLAAALGGAVAGAIVGLSYRDWLFLRVFELKIFFLDPWGIGVVFAFIFAGLIALVEAVWIVLLAFVWLLRTLGRGLGKVYT